MLIFRKTSTLAVSQMFNPQVLGTVAMVAVQRGVEGVGKVAEEAAGRLVGDSVKRAAEAVRSHLADHSDRLPAALATSNDRAWKTIEIALGGQRFWDRFASAEDRALREGVQSFLESSIPADDPEFLRRCLQELRRARGKGHLNGEEGFAAASLSEDLGPFARFDDPEALLAAECRMVEDVAGEFRRLGYAHLGRLLAITPNRGQPLLATAVQYYFRRAVGNDEVLSRELTWTKLRTIDRSLEDGFALLALIQERQAESVDEALDGLSRVETITVETRDGVMTLIENVKALTEQHQLLRRDLTAGHSVSYRDEQELALLRRIKDQYRALSEEQRNRFPALGLDVARLEVVAGEFTDALETARDAASHLETANARAEAHHTAYRAALELKDWDNALAELKEAIALDDRFALWPVGKYEVDRILGAGAFGVAFLCHHRYKNRRVVLKTFEPVGLDRDVRTIFQEAQALDQLNHPGIVRLFDCGFVDEAGQSRPYLEIEHVDGSESLEQYIQINGPLNVDDLMPIASQMAEALRAAHLKEILHRDIKPANLLIGRTDLGWQVKVIDFGLALRRSLMRTGHTQSAARGRTMIGSAVAGTLHYASPEQLDPKRSHEVGPHSDVFGFGRTCLFALFGTTHPRARQITALPDPWPDLLDDCCDVGIALRPADFSAVLERLQTAVGPRPEPATEQSPAPPEPPLPTVSAPAPAVDPWLGSEAGERKLLRLDDLEIPFRWCPPGTFLMGSPENEPEREDDENQVEVTLTRGFWMLETPVTQELWQDVMGGNPSHFKGSANLPVESVSWDDATKFGATLTERLRHVNQLPPEWTIGLPTEAQWEYACRAGTTTATAFGNQLESRQANFDGNYLYNGAVVGPYLKRTSPVRSYPPNVWGLYDMHGNVWEWCCDFYRNQLQAGADPICLSQASNRVYRGGCWYNFGGYCRSAYRSRGTPEDRRYDLGFRLAAVQVE